MRVFMAAMVFVGAVCTGAFHAGAAQAAPLPPVVEAMIREAAKDDSLAAVVNAAKAVNPASLAEIDTLVARLKADAVSAREERLSAAGLLDNWSGTGVAGFSRTSGNTNDLTMSGAADLTKEGLHFRHKFQGAVDYQTTRGVLTRDRYRAGYQLDYKFNEHIYAYGSLGWEKDTFAGIRRRLSESGGAGYTVLDTGTMRLDITAGPALQQTRYVTGLPENSTTLRSGGDFSWKVFDALTFSEKAEIFINSEIKSTTALTIPVRDTLSAQLAFDYFHQDNVPAGRTATDTASRVSLVYSF
jgi:putative salt-induced outer membrane protein